MVASPNFTWATGNYDLFVLYLLLPIPGYYYQPIPIPLYQKPYWKCPDALWDYLPEDGWCLWLVLGVNTKTDAYEVTPLQYFQKVSDCVVSFPDAVLEGVIRDAIGKPTGDILASDLGVLTSLEAWYLDISELEGMEYCFNLTELSLLGNGIVDLSPLAGLTNLIDLAVSDNQIVDVAPLAGLTNLIWLFLDGNQIVDVSPLAGLTNLIWLLLYGNQIVDVSPLAGLTSLDELWLDANQILEVAPLAGLTDLYWLTLTGNQITDMCPLVDNSGLGSGDHVDLSDNPLSTNSCTVCIPQLESRGVFVDHDCP